MKKLLMTVAFAGAMMFATIRDAEAGGATIEFKVGDNVTYLVITLPNGQRIIREIGKKG
tara:strand:- start:2159 stop:2335 length:177 start_codon:yes stop_codon:yes gene_type:complete